MSEIQVQMPLDSDGFIRRECPTCVREFKWHWGKTDDAPSDFVYPDVYWCPLCGKAAGHDQWWTPAQIEYMHGAAAPALHDEAVRELRKAFKTGRNSFFKMEVKEGSRPDEPDPLVDEDDMVLIAPPCHPWEPVKVPEGASAPFYCLVCGDRYAV